MWFMIIPICENVRNLVLIDRVQRLGFRFCVQVTRSTVSLRSANSKGFVHNGKSQFTLHFLASFRTI